MKEKIQCCNNNIGTRRKILKILGASGLALFMGAGTLCGVLLAPANAAANMAAREEAAIAAQEQAAAEAQEALLNGTLELDPETDPVLGTTESGITIRYHNKALSGTWNYDTFMTNYFGSTTSTYQSGNFNNLSGYLYITLGSWNWIIIGRNSSLNTVSFTNTYAQSNESVPNFLKFTSYNSYANALKGLQDSTPAGSSITAENSKQIVNTISGISRSYSVTLSSFNVISTPDLDNYSNCVLCLCATTTGESAYDNTSPYSCYFPGSALDTAMTNVYNSISSAAGNQIQLTSLSTPHPSKGSGYYQHSEHLFPLCTGNGSNTLSNFCVERYLDTASKRRCDNPWWLRDYSPLQYSSTNGMYVLNTGEYYLNSLSLSFIGVRPCFVLKIT